jgi:predicted dehydrogenase
VIICTPDHLHAPYILCALAAGCDVICEKPLTIDADQIARIAHAQQNSGRRVRVAFNYRYAPARVQIRRLLAAGAIGQITSVDFRWHLDRAHGADYFRRWHRQVQNSGGLFVHKATHHFDLLSWWLRAAPLTVQATARRRFYRPETAVSLGLHIPGPRCATCAERASCDFALDLAADPDLDRLYRQAEAADGYFRDLCVFAPNVDIHDTMEALISFSDGSVATYGLTAYSPWEGLAVTFHGTEGQLVHRHSENHGIPGASAFVGQGTDSMETVLHRAGAAPEGLKVDRGTGGHGGADPVMLAHLFDPAAAADDPDGLASDQRDGARSVLTGLAAAASAQSGLPVTLASLLPKDLHAMVLG